MARINQILGKLNRARGKELELVVAKAIKTALLLLDLRDVRVSLAQAKESHYDIELIFPHPSGPKRAYVEVKGSERMDRLVRRINEAFRREHPEPFCVIGVLGYPRDPTLLLRKVVPAWIWIKPGKEGKLGRFGPKNLKKWLKRKSIIPS